ncbi:MAG: hypothetical protein AAF514_13240 [Verrucomicrobiota bacterium]
MKAEELQDLPGSELVIAGLDDLANGVFDSVEALLVAIGSPRLRALGIELPYRFSELPEHELYFKLAGLHGIDAHSKYNGLVRRLVSFERALDGRNQRERSTSP